LQRWGWDFTLPFQITLCPWVLQSIQGKCLWMSVGKKKRLAYHLVTFWQRENQKVPNNTNKYKWSISTFKGDLPICIQPPKNIKKIQVIHKVAPNRAFSGPPFQH
jgi:hypothetical protein